MNIKRWQSKRINRNNQAVSAVIAVILMIAIVVAGAAAAMFYFMSMSEGRIAPPAMSLISTKKSSLSVIKGPNSGTYWNDIGFKIEGIELDSSSLDGSSIYGGQDIPIVAMVMNDPQVSAKITGSELFTVELIHHPSNSVLSKYTFPTPVSLNTWQNWKYRKVITIDHTKVSSDLTNFPVLISITDKDLQQANPQGSDIAFVQSGSPTTILNYEIEYFDQKTGELIAWVNIPTLSASADTQIYVYYNNPTGISPDTSSATWKNSYKMVNHMSGSSIAELTDSTRNGHDPKELGKSSNPSYGQVAKIGKGVEFTGDDYLDLTPSSDFETQQFTISAYAKNSIGANTGLNIFSYQPINSEANPSGLHFRDNIVEFGEATGAAWNTASRSFPHTMGTWYYYTIVYNGADMIYYINGNEDRRTTGAISFNVPIQNGLLNPPTKLATIGSYYNNGYSLCFDGIMDELRYSTDVHSQEWIETEFANMNNPSSFISVGMQQELG